MTFLATIGFTQRSARSFFGALQGAGIELLADIRLNNTGQLAGFTKKEDLAYFLELLGIRYRHLPMWAPTKEIRDRYHDTGDWDTFENGYRTLLAKRTLPAPEDLTLVRATRICLLCSEPKPDRCHRRVAAEVLAAAMDRCDVRHL